LWTFVIPAIPAKLAAGGYPGRRRQMIACRAAFPHGTGLMTDIVPTRSRYSRTRPTGLTSATWMEAR